MWHWVAAAIACGWLCHILATLSIWSFSVLIIALVIAGCIGYWKYQTMDSYQAVGQLFNLVGDLATKLQEQQGGSPSSVGFRVRQSVVELQHGKQVIWLPYSEQNAKRLKDAKVYLDTLQGREIAYPIPGVPCLVTPNELQASKVVLSLADGTLHTWSGDETIDWFSL